MRIPLTLIAACLFVSAIYSFTYDGNVNESENYLFEEFPCDNLTYGGTIGVDQFGCGSTFDPEVIQNTALPTGGSGSIEYLWLKSTTTCTAPNGSNDSEWQEISGANGHSYDPGPISETTCYLRCARRSGCNSYDGESNVITVEVVPNTIEATLEPAGPFCSSAGTTQLVGSPSGGVFHGPGVSSSGVFNPSIANSGDNTIYYIVSEEGCEDTAEITISVADCDPGMNGDIFNDCGSDLSLESTIKGILSGGQCIDNISNSQSINQIVAEVWIESNKCNNGHFPDYITISFDNVDFNVPGIDVFQAVSSGVPEKIYRVMYDGSASSVCVSGTNGCDATSLALYIERSEADASSALATYNQELHSANGPDDCISSTLNLGESDLPRDVEISVPIHEKDNSRTVRIEVDIKDDNNNSVYSDTETFTTQNAGEDASLFNLMLQDVPGNGVKVEITICSPEGNGDSFGIGAVTATANGCVSCDVTVSASNDGPLSGMMTSVQLTATSNAGNPQWSWTGPNGFTSSMQNPVISEPGTYHLTVTDLDTGCSASTSTHVDRIISPPSDPSCDASDFLWDNNVEVNGTSVSFGVRLQSSNTQFLIPTNTYPTAFDGPVFISIPEVVSWDGYTNRVNTSQSFEQWKVLFFKDGSIVHETVYTNDLADNVISAEWKGPLMGEVFFPNGVDEILVVHYEDNTYGEGGQPSANSVIPSTICFEFETCDVEVVASADPICDGESSTLTASGSGGSGGYTYEWSDGLGSGSSVSTGILSNNTTYHVTATDSQGCSAVGSVMVIVNPNPEVLCQFNLYDGQGWQFICETTVCEGSKVGFAAHPVDANGYQWSGPNGFSTTDRFFVFEEVTAEMAGQYTVTYTDENGCSDTEILTLNVDSQQEISIVADDTEVCLGESVGLTATIDGGTGSCAIQWQRREAGGSWTDAHSGGTTITAGTGFLAAPGVYEYRALYACDGSSCAEGVSNVVSIEVYGLPSISADNDGPLTGVMTTVQLTAESDAANPEWDWSGPNAYVSEMQNPTISEAGTYNVTVTDLNTGCTNTTSTTVTIEPTGPSAPNCDGNSFLWDNSVEVNGTSVSFGERLSSNNTQYLIPTSSYPTAFGGQVIISIPEAISWDGYVNRVNANQGFEQWKVVFLKGGVVQYETGYTDDLEDNVVSAEWKGSLMGEIVFPNGVDEILLVHYEDNEFGEGGQATSNSVIPSTICFDYKSCDLEASALAEPNPVCEGESTTLAASANGGAGGYVFEWSDGLGSGSSVLTGPIASDVTYSVTVTDSEGCSDVATVTVELEDKAIVGDFVFIDINNNGIQDAEDTALNGVSVTLFKAGGMLVDQTTTVNGLYEFEVCAGDYYVGFGEVNDAVRSPKDATADDLDSDADLETGLTDVFTLNPGDVNRDVDAGYSFVASIGDFVFEDTNADGQQDAGEEGIEGVTVSLTDADGNPVTDADGNPVMDVMTGMDGEYEFTNLVPGDYIVVFETPEGFAASPSNQGDDATDSDADEVTGESSVVNLESGENDETIDAGYYGSASLGDFVWLDTNANGQQDAGEEGIEGVTVSLTDADGNPVTDASGNPVMDLQTGMSGEYEFTNLVPGDYIVVFEAPTDLKPSPSNEGDDATDSDADEVTGESDVVNLESGENDPTIDAGYYAPASIGDFVFEDTNADGQQDAGEEGIEGVTVSLTDADGNPVTDADGNPVMDVQTGMNGEYEFTNLVPGDYIVVFGMPEGFEPTPSDQGDDATDSDADEVTGASGIVNLESGETEETVDAGYYVPARLGDFVWLDSNADGQQDAGEEGIEGVTVSLTDADGNPVTDVDGNPVADVETGIDGDYEFNNLVPGDYIVVFEAPADLKPSPSNEGDDATDSDADEVTGASAVVNLESRENDPTIDAGYYAPASIGDFVFEDTDADGQQDPGEDGIEGVTVSLTDADGNPVTDADGNPVMDVQTGMNGAYEFTNLVPGDYIIVFEAPQGLTPSPSDQGDDATDSDADEVTGESSVVNLESGENDETIDAGYYGSASLGDFVWLDTNANGQQDAGEEGIEGVTVSLTDADGNTVTDASGNLVMDVQTGMSGEYEFTNLVPGDYIVVFEAPADLKPSPSNEGDDATDSDADEVTGESDVVNLESEENDPTIDAGYYVPASIGDFVFEDSNADGQQDAGEEGIEGVTVSLTDADGNPVTDADGNPVMDVQTGMNGEYEFTNLVPGDYIVVFETPEGFETTPSNQGNDTTDSDADEVSGASDVITLESGETEETVDAGYYAPASLGDFVWLDSDADGQQDAGEEGIEGVTVSLTDADGNPVTAVDGNPVMDVQTGMDGEYEFTNLLPGDYIVVFEAPADLKPSPSNEGDDATDSDADEVTGASDVVNLESGDDDPTIDAGYYAPASIGDFVFEDTDANGQQDPGEEGIEGVTVSLTDADGNPVTDADGNPVMDVMTGMNGEYEFTNLVPGDYIVVFEMPEGFEPSPSDEGDDATDSDADEVTGASGVINLESGEIEETVDAGYYVPARLGDFVWLDSNSNGQQDAGEEGIEGVTVSLTDADGNPVTDVDGNPVADVVTGMDGDYEFNNLVPGDYIVVFGAPADLKPSPSNEGDDETDSDADETTGASDIVNLESREYDPTIDAGYYAPASIGDFVFEDTNANGQQDPGEEGIEGVTVSLTDADGNPVTDADGNPVMDVQTGMNGEYEFTNLVPGDYIVVFETPDGFETTPSDQGDDATDSDADETTGASDVITLESGETEETVDAGYYAPASLGDFVWLDTNANGQQDGGEEGIEGVTVSLTDADGDQVADVDGNPVMDVETGMNGEYEFTNLVPGDYIVVFEAPADLKPSPSNEGDDATDSDADEVTGASDVVNLESGENDPTIDAGYYAPASIGDYVWYDFDNDGIQDAGEEGIEGVIVSLTDADGNPVTDADGNPVMDVMTGMDGAYEFTNLVPGDYIVVFETPEGFAASPQDATGATGDEGDSNDDSDIDENGMSYVVNLTSGEEEGDVDAGFTQVADLSLIKSVDNELPFVGQVVNFTIEVANDGFSNASGVAVTDTLPSGYSNITNITPAAFVDGNIVTWSDLSIPANGSITLTVSAEVNAPGVGIDYQNIAQIDAADQYDPDSEPGNSGDVDGDGLVGSEDPDGSQDPDDEDDGDDATVNPAVPGISILKKTNGRDINVEDTPVILVDLDGEPVTWTYDIENTGNVDLVDVQIVDDVEGFICVLPFLGAGQTAQCSLTGDAELGMYTNIGTVTGTPVNDNGDPIGDPISAMDTSEYIGVFINIEKVADKEVVCPGEEVTYTLTVRMRGGAPGIQIGDISFEDNNFPGVTFDINSPEFITDTDIDSDGFIAFIDPDGDGVTNEEFMWEYSLIITEDNTNTAMDMGTIYFNGSPVGVANNMSTVVVTVDETLCAELGDYVWFDENADGDQDAGEDGINGVTVNLYEDADNDGSPDGGIIETTTTATNPNTGNDGYYQFSALLPSTYIVEFVSPGADYVSSPANEGDDTSDSDADPLDGRTESIILMAGDSNQDVDAGFFLPAEIGDIVWNDEDGDGIYDPVNEDGISGVTVSLSDENGNPVTDLDENTVGDVMTGPDGSYVFDNLPPGMYIVTFTTPDGFIPTPSDVGGFDTDATDIDGDSDADPISGESHVIDLVAGEMENDIDAGFFEPASLGDFVWNDADGNGIQDAGEDGIDGITVNLYVDSDMDGEPDDPAAPLASTTTGDDPSTPSTEQGYYEFTDLPAGDYVVEFLTPGLVNSPADQGGDDTIDSDVDPETGYSSTVNLSPGEDDPSIDAGVYTGGSIGDIVWLDNPFGETDVYDPGIDAIVDGVIVMLLKENEGGEFVMVDQQETTLSGYLFEDLPAGNYQVKFTAPGGNVFVSPNQGGDETVDSDAIPVIGDPSTGISPTIMLGAGEENLDVDAGLTLPPVPVELVSFTGVWNEEKDVNELEWITSIEINNDFFLVERSFGNTDDFEQIARVDGHGTTTELITYEVDDRSIAENGIYFYRLKQVDFDGTSEYSEIISIRVERDLNTEITIYPNPTVDYVTVDITTEKEEDIDIHLFDSAGKLIRTQTIKAADVQVRNAIQIDVRSLPAAIYNLIIKVGDDLHSKRIDVIK